MIISGWPGGAVAPARCPSSRPAQAAPGGRPRRPAGRGPPRRFGGGRRLFGRIVLPGRGGGGPGHIEECFGPVELARAEQADGAVLAVVPRVHHHFAAPGTAG